MVNTQDVATLVSVRSADGQLKACGDPATEWAEVDLIKRGAFLDAGRKVGKREPRKVGRR